MSAPDADACVQCGKLRRRCIIATVDRVAELTRKANASNARSHAADCNTNGDRPASVNSYIQQQSSVSGQRADDKAISMLHLDISNTHQCRSSSSSESVCPTSGPQSDDGLRHFDSMRANSQFWMDDGDFLPWNSFDNLEQELSLPFTFDNFDPYIDSTGSKYLWNRSPGVVDWSCYLHADDNRSPTTPQVKCPPENIVWCPQHRELIPDETQLASGTSITDWNFSENLPTFPSG